MAGIEAFVHLIPDLSGFSQQVNTGVSHAVAGSGADRSGRSLGSRMALGMGKALKGGALTAGVTAAGVMGVALTKGFNRLSAIDTAKKKLAGLGNSAKDIDKIMTNASASVKGTAFGLDEAATTAAGAVAAGIKPGKQLQGVLNTVADTASIAGASMGDMGAIFGSVAARGKLQGDDLMQLQSRGVPVLAFLAKHYKTTAKEASVMVSKGKVDFKNFNAAMHENLGGAALKSGDTVKGAMANVQAALGRIGAGLLGGVFPKIAPLLQKITSSMGPIEDIATKAGGAIGGVLASGFSTLGDLMGRIDFKGIGSAIGSTFGKVKQIIGVFFKGDFSHGPFQEDSPVINFFFNVRDAISNLLPKITSFGSGVGTVFQALLPHLKEFAAGMGGVARDVGPLAKAVGGFLVSAFQSALPYLKTAGLILGGAFVIALKIIPPILHTVISALTGMFNIVKPLMPVIAAAAAGFVAFKLAMGAWSIATKIAAGVTRAFAIAQGILNAVMDANPIMLTVIALAALAGGLYLAYQKSAVFRAIVNGAFSAIKSVVSGVLGWFTGTLVPFFTQTLPGVFQGVLDWVTGHWKLILGLITGPIGAAVLLVVTHWDSIKNTFSAAWTWVTTTFSSLWNGLKTILSKPVQYAKDAVQRDINLVKGIFNSIWGWATSTFRAAWSGLKNIVSVPVNLAKMAIQNDIALVKGIFNSVWSWATGTFRKTWSGIQSIVSKPVNLAKGVIQREIDGIKTIFSKTKDAIGTVWSGLLGKITGPISSVVNWIGSHFVNPINSLLSKVGVGLRIPWPSVSRSAPVGHGGGRTIQARYASGGVLPGYSPGHDNMHFAGPHGLLSLSGGEGISRPEVVRAMGTKMFNNLNAAARSGGVAGVRKALAFSKGGVMPHHSYGMGGVLDWGKNVIGSAWSGIKNIGGYAVDIAKMVANPGGALSALAHHLLGGISGSLWGQVLSSTMLSGVKGIASSIKNMFTGGGGGGGASGLSAPKNVSGSKAIGRAMAAQMGWTGSQWNALYNLWMGESGWNANAYNASSGATGIPQSLPGSKMASAGADWRTNPATQIRWGLGYIKGRYGSPANAYGQWLARNPHWYRNGTSFAQPGWSIVGENGPEAVHLRGGERIATAGQTRRMGGISASSGQSSREPGQLHVHGDVNINHGTDLDDLMNKFSFASSRLG